MTDHMARLQSVFTSDAHVLTFKEATYRGSWKKRGGVGAWMMACRKFDRLEAITEARGYDIFTIIAHDPSGRDGSALAEVRDLRRYLALIEAEMVARGVVVPEEPPTAPGTPEDGGHHARQPTPERMDDGLTEIPAWAFIGYLLSDGRMVYNVDRRRYPRSETEHLPQLDYELNHKEWEETPAHYQWMYEWDKGAEKWRLSPQYVEHWTRR